MASSWHRLHISKRLYSAQIGSAIHHTPASSARNALTFRFGCTESGMSRIVKRQEFDTRVAQPEGGRSLLNPDATRFMSHIRVAWLYTKGDLRAIITLQALYIIQHRFDIVNHNTIYISIDYIQSHTQQLQQQQPGNRCRKNSSLAPDLTATLQRVSHFASPSTAKSCSCGRYYLCCAAR